jgi:hypothetical protein
MVATRSLHSAVGVFLCVRRGGGGRGEDCLQHLWGSAKC